MPELSDADLMSRVRTGDRDAFATLVDRHKDMMVNYLTRMTGSRERAEETAQEAFLRLYRAAPRYQEQGHLTGYLYRIATNLVRQEQRRERRRRLLAAAFMPRNGRQPASNGRPADISPHAQLVRAELQQHLLDALARLPLRYRVAVVLHDVQGWPYRDIARMTGCREGTVKSRINRGRRQLRAWLSPHWSDSVGG